MVSYETANKIEDLIRKNKKISFSEISEKTKHQHGTIKRVLEELEKKKIIRIGMEAYKPKTKRRIVAEYVFGKVMKK